MIVQRNPASAGGSASGVPARRGALAAVRPWLVPWPWLTTAVWAVIAACAGLQYLVPGMAEALRRDHHALAAGQWWRMITPLLVQTDGAAQIAVNLVALAVFGVLAERLFGWARWLLLFCSAALVGEITGYAWMPDGGGVSIAICGLAGGVIAELARRDARLPLVARLAAVYWCVALAAEALAGPVATIPVTVAAGVLVQWLPAGDAPGPQARLSAGRVAAALSTAAALALTVRLDHHGASLLTGLAVALLVTARGRVRCG